MFKFGICALIGAAFLVNVAMCNDEDTIWHLSKELITNFPRYLQEAMEEEEGQMNLNATTLLFEKHQCLKDYMKIFVGIARKKMWAIQVIDSWGKFPAGVTRGNMYELGDFDECLAIHEPNTFEPRYCVTRISTEELVMPKAEFTGNALKTLNGVLKDFTNGGDNGIEPRIVPTTSNMMGLNFGVCLPKSCTQEKIEGFLKMIQKRVLRNKAVLAVVPDTCQVKEDLGWNLETADYFCLALLIFLIVLVVPSTIYDIAKSSRDEEKTMLYTAFSVYTNGRKLFACNRPKSETTMDCLNGIRVFSALWVIYAHAHVMTMMGPVYNYAYIPEWTAEYYTFFILMAPFSVDTFLFLSGLLVAWSLLRHMDKTKGRINVLMLYVHRYLRLTPVLALVIFISVTLFKKMASGPLWFLFVNHAIMCDQYWWSSLLYIQNYYNVDSICLSHTWYLSVDMQLFLFSPLLCYLLYRFGYIFVPVLGLLVAGCMGWTYWLYVHFNLVNQLLSINNDIQLTFNVTYFPTHVRIIPWVAGVAFAYLLAKVQGRRQNWSVGRVVIHWAVTIAVFSVLAVYTFQLQQMSHTGTPFESALYTPISRLTWSVFLCLLVYACVKGYGGPINWFLSWPQWQPLARLTYGIYLVHMPVMLLSLASQRKPAYFSGRVILFKFFGDFLAATILSIVVAFLLESPMVVLEKVMFTPKKKLVLPTSETVRVRRDSAAVIQPSAPANS